MIKCKVLLCTVKGNLKCRICGRRSEMIENACLEWVTGQNTSAPLARSTTTTVRQKCHNGRNHATGWRERGAEEEVVASKNATWIGTTAVAVAPEDQVSFYFVFLSFSVSCINFSNVIHRFLDQFVQ
jgi:hypothetical protein